jgi:hypothetical protein
LFETGLTQPAASLKGRAGIDGHDAIMRSVLVMIGIGAIALGAFWIIQSGGWSPWPLSRLTIPSNVWLWHGAIPILGGSALMVLARRL